MRKPVRQCVSCRERREKADLIRLVNSNGCAVPDREYKADGRGAYICRDPKCIEMSRKRHALDRALKITVTDEVYDILKRMADE